MNKLLYGTLALMAAHVSNAAIVVSGATGGPLSISIDAPIVFNSIADTASGDLVLVLANAYSSDQTSGNFAFSSASFTLSAPSITDGGNATVAQIVPSPGAADYDFNDLGIVFNTNQAARFPGEQFTISIGAASTASAMTLPTNSGSYDLYMVDDNGERFTDLVSTNVSFVAVPEAGMLASAFGALSLLALLASRRR